MIAPIASTEKPMAAVQEIPPPDVKPRKSRRWALPVALLGLAMAIAGFVSLTRPLLPTFDWIRHHSPPGSVNLDSLVAVDDGVAVLSGMTSGGILLWSLDHGAEWESQPLSGAPSQLASLGDSLLAYGIREGQIVDRADVDWVESLSVQFPAELHSRQASGQPSLIGNRNSLLAITLIGDVWWTPNGEEFTKVVADPRWGPGVEQPFYPSCRPPSRSSPDIPPVVETDAGFVAMVSTNPAEPFGLWPVCEPEVWVSDDGRTWTETGSVIGDGAFVYDMAWREGRFTAVGGFGVGEPTAWTSENGIGWEAIPGLSGGLDIDLFTVEAGGAGWVVLGRDEDSHDLVGWTSRDGLCWEPLPEYVSGADAAVSQNQIVVLERGSVSALWLGTPTGGHGACG